MGTEDVIDMRPIFDFIKVALADGMRFADAMASVIGECERRRPHPDWARLRKLEIEADLLHLERWLERLFDIDPPGGDITGLWFGMSNPGRRPTADLYVRGGAYDAEDLAWTGG